MTPSPLRCAVALVVALAAAGVSSARERAFPLLQVYSTSEHDASSQNFDVTEDGQGVVYFANEHGLLEFDGSWWRLFKLGHDASAFSVAVAHDGTVVVGSDSDFGYMRRDSSGEMRYVPLSGALPAALGPIGQTIHIIPTDKGVYFVTEGAVARWDGQHLSLVKKLSRDLPVARTFLIGGKVWISSEDGLETLDGDGVRGVAGGKLFRGKRLRLLLPVGPGRFLINEQGGGLALFDGHRVVPFAEAASKIVAHDRITAGVALPDGRYAVVTRGAGILVLRPNGELDQAIDASVGLPSSDIAAARLMSDGSLWLALDDCVVRLDISSPISVIDSRGALRGSVEALARHDQSLYVGTTSGLFRIDGADASDPATPAAHHLAPRILSCWSLLDVDGELLAGSDSGVHLVSATGAAAQLPAPFKFVAYTLVRSKVDPSYLYAGGDRGILLFHHDESGWRYAGAVENTPVAVRTIVEDPGSVLWLGTAQGLARLELPGGPSQPARARIQRWGDGSWIVTRAGGRLVGFSSGSTHPMRIDVPGSSPVPDRELGNIGNGTEIQTAIDDGRGNVWFATTPIGVATQKAGQWAFDDRRLLALPKLEVDSMLAEPDGVIWIGSERGLFRFDSLRQPTMTLAHRPLIRRVLASGREMSLAAGNEFRSRDAKRIRIELSALSFDGGARYQYRLLPGDEEWSPWSPEPLIEFTNLFEGNYTLQVRTRRTNGTGDLLNWAFTVLPPWYRRGAAYVLWVALAVSLVAALWLIRTGTLRRRAAALERRVAEQTQELREGVEQLRVARDALSEKNEALEMANARLQELSFDDALTGIANRRRLEQMLQIEWNHAQRRGACLGLIMLDLDHFKLLNDLLGHQEGDESLRRVARFLASSIRRAGDLAARYGGEEFAVVLPETDTEGATHFAEQLRAGVEALGISHTASPHHVLTASFGVASLRPQNAETPYDLISAADRALYRAKAAGRNCVRAEESQGQRSTMSA